MQNLSIESFSPKRAELELVANKYKNLSIEGVEDKTGYKLVDEARKDLKKKRVEIEKTGKELRDEANKFAKGVIALQNELVSIIEPVEKALKEKQEKIDLEKQRLERLILLPDRKKRLEEIRQVKDIVIFTMPTDEELLDMDIDDFQEFFNQKKGEFLEEKENQIRIVQEEADRKKKEAELEEQRLKDLEKAREEARLDALKEAETNRLADESRKKREEEQKKADEEAERIKLEKKKKYQQWLIDNGCIEETKEHYYIVKTENEVILYKKISTFKL